MDIPKCEKCGKPQFESRGIGKPHKLHNCERTTWQDWLHLSALIIFGFLTIVYGALAGDQKVASGLLAIILVIFASFISSKNFHENFYKRLTLAFTIIGVGIAVLSIYYVLISIDKSNEALSVSTDSLNLTKEELRRNIELDQNIQNSLAEGLDYKLGRTATAAKLFLDNTNQYVEGDLLYSTRLPSDFDTYTTEMRITDPETIKGLLNLNEATKRVNITIDYSYQILLLPYIDQVKAKTDNWKKEMSIMKLILQNSCVMKLRLAQLRGKEFQNPKIGEYHSEFNPALIVTDQPVCG